MFFNIPSQPQENSRHRQSLCPNQVYRQMSKQPRLQRPVCLHDPHLIPINNENRHELETSLYEKVTHGDLRALEHGR